MEEVGKTPRGDYKEYEAKSDGWQNSLADLSEKREAKVSGDWKSKFLPEPIEAGPLSIEEKIKAVLNSCKRSVAVGDCSDGHTVAKLLLCGREYCPDCGSDGSDSHMRRYSRLIEKAKKMASVGLWVLEFPLADRENISIEDMRSFGKAAKRAFKSLGYSRGFRRWHFFGDPRCPRGCQDHGKNRRKKPRSDQKGIYTCPVCGEIFSAAEAEVGWNPHLNLLVNGGFLSPEELKAKVAFLRSRLGEKLIVNYRFADEPAAIMHKLRYLTRATFHSWEWSPDRAAGLENFRNTSWWGGPTAWAGENQWEVPAGEEVLLPAHTCPACGGSVTWRQGVHSVDGWCPIMTYPGGLFLVRLYAVMSPAAA